MSKYSISIIIPVYNSEKYLKKCLESVVNQTLKDIEIIIVNDGSTDESDSIILEYIKENNKKNIVYLKQENRGQAVARNNALKEANGEYICFVDSDDYIDTAMCEKLYDRAKQAGADIVVCDIMAYYDNQTQKLQFNFSKYSDDAIKNYIISNAGPCAKIIKTSIIKENNLFFKEGIIYEDLAVVPAYGLLANKIEYIEQPLYYYYQRTGSTMNPTAYNKKLESIFIAMDVLEKTFEKYDQQGKYKEELEFIYISHFLHNAALRFIAFDEGIKQANIISDMMKKKYPLYRKNKYYEKSSFKYRYYCNKLFEKKYSLVKRLSAIKSFIKKG